MIDKGSCDKGFIWNPSNCNCECDKSSDKLVEECSENIDGNEMICNGTLNNYRNVCDSCRIYIVWVVIAFLIIIGITSAFIYFDWFLKKDNIRIKFNTNTQTTIY